MIDNYKIITLCGSVKFKDDFLKMQEKLSLDGNIVLTPIFFDHTKIDFTADLKQFLDDMHKRKIDLADEIFVINKDSYIGQSTKSEIEYARKKGKKVNYMEPETENQNNWNN